MMLRRTPVLVLVLVFVVGLAGCGSDDHGDSAASESSTTTTTSAGQVSEWLAVYHVAPYEDDVRTAFMADAGPHVFEGAASCFDGVPDRLGVEASTMILGLVAPTKSELETAAKSVDGSIRLQGAFSSNCRD